MKKYTKVLAAFCATAMIFGSFSATVFADEVAAGDQESSSEKPSDYYDAPSVREDAFAEGFESLDARVKRIEAENKDAQSGNDDTQAGVDDDYPEGYGIPGVNGSQAGTNGDQAGADGVQAGADGTQSGTDGDQSGTDEPKVDEKASADQMDDTKKNDDTKAEMAKNGAAEGQDAGSDPVDQPVNNPEEPEQVVLFANGVITQSDINSNGFKMPETAGTYTLSEDITVSAGAKIETQDASVTINLNGHTIIYTGTDSMYIVGKIRGANTNGTGLPDLNNSATGVTLTINGTGTISGERNTGTGSKDYWINGTGVGTNDNRGGCVLVEWNSTFILDGATITGFEATDEGGAIFVSNGANFVMNSGIITNCYAGKGGGAISGNASSAEHGPNGENLKASVTINDGLISGNEAGQLGGGIRISRCHFYLYGGTITDNNVKANSGSNGGGGIEIYPNTFGHEVFVQGSPKVYGNKVKGTVDGERANIFFDVNGNFQASFILSGNLSASAKLGFSAKSTSANCFDINGKSYSLNSFVSNHAGYYAYVSGSYIKLKQGTLPKVEAYQLVIAGDIKMRAALDLGTFADSNTSVNYAYSYTKGSNTVNISKTVAFSSLGTNGSLYTVDIPVESACFTSPITVTINYSDGEVSDDPVTIDRYISAIMNGNYTDKVKAVAYSLRTFGSFAMMQFNINMNDDSLHPANDEINASLYDPQIVIYQKYLIGEGAAYTPENDLEGAFYGASVNFLSKTEVNMYFKKSVLGTTAPTMTVTYSDNSTETISATENGSYYVYTVKGPSGDGFAATLFDVPFNFSVGNVSGEYSINTYLQVVEYKYHGDTNNILLKLVEAYYDFARKCQQL